MVTLRPLTDAEYDAYISTTLEDYAAERAQSDDTPLEEERKVASAQTASLLPQGLRTPGTVFWRVEADDGASVGSLWVHAEAEKRRTFIFDIVVDAAQRGKGYGEATMRAGGGAAPVRRHTHWPERLRPHHRRPRALRHDRQSRRRHLHARAHRQGRVTERWRLKPRLKAARRHKTCLRGSTQIPRAQSAQADFAA